MLQVIWSSAVLAISVFPSAISPVPPTAVDNAIQQLHDTLKKDYPNRQRRAIIKCHGLAIPTGISMSITTGISSAQLGILSTLKKTSQQKSTLLSQLSSGKKINSGKDDPVGIASINALSAQIKGTQVASNSMGYTASTLGTASGGMMQLMDSLQNLRAIAVQAADGTISGTDRQALATQSTSILSGMDQITQNTTMGGVSLLDGSFTNKTIQTGPNAGDNLTVSIGSTTTASLGVAGLDLSSSESASNAIGLIDDAISKMTGELANVGSAQNRLDSAANTNDSIMTALIEARSQKEDVDMARATASLVQANIMQVAQVYVLSQSLKNEKTKMSLTV